MTRNMGTFDRALLGHVCNPGAPASAASGALVIRALALHAYLEPPATKEEEIDRELERLGWRG